MRVTVRKPRRFQEILTGTLLTALLGLGPAAAGPPGPIPAKDPSLAEAVRRHLARLQLETDFKELVQVRSDLRKTTIELDVLQAALKQQPDTVSDEAIDLAIDQDLTVKDHLAAVKKKQDDLARLEAAIAGGRNSPLYKDEQTKLFALEKELAARRRKLRPIIENELKQKSLVDVAGRIKSAQEHLTVARALEKKLVADIGRLTGETGLPVPAQDDRLRALEKEVRELKQALEALKKQGAGKGG